VVAHQGDGAALAGARDDVVGVRARADHVAQRPERFGAAGVGRGDDRVERLGVRVGVGEHCDQHGVVRYGPCDRVS